MDNEQTHALTKTGGTLIYMKIRYTESRREPYNGNAAAVLQHCGGPHLGLLIDTGDASAWIFLRFFVLKKKTPKVAHPTDKRRRRGGQWARWGRKVETLGCS